MTNSSLQRFDQDGIELIIDTQTGESFASQAGYARMSGVDYSTIRKRVERLGVTLEPLKRSQIETVDGFRAVTLIPEDLICQWLIKDNHKLALKVMQLGVRLFLHTIAGFQVKSDAIETNEQLESQIDELTAKIDELDYKEAAYIDEIWALKDRIKEIEDEKSTLEVQIELMEGY